MDLIENVAPINDKTNKQINQPIGKSDGNLNNNFQVENNPNKNKTRIISPRPQRPKVKVIPVPKKKEEQKNEGTN